MNFKIDDTRKVKICCLDNTTSSSKMASVLRNENLVIMYMKNFLFFEWKLYSSDFEKSPILSSEFYVGGEKSSFLEFDFTTFIYLYLHNPKCIQNGYYTITLFDANMTTLLNPLFTKTDPIIDSDKIDFIKPSVSLPQMFPITIICMAKASDTSMLVESSTLMARMTELSTDLKTILNQEINTDLIFNVDEQSIKAHKLVLQARSPVFRKMFDNDSRESADNTVVISDIGSDTMKKLVGFLYTATKEKCSFDENLELYYAADKYEVLSLRDNCKSELLDNLDVNNACSLFTLAARHNDEDLKEKVVQFISANLKSVVNKDSLNEMNKGDIISLMTLSVSKMK